MKYLFFLSAFLMSFLSFTTTIAAGSNHSLFLDTEANVWVTGRNYRGQLGLSDELCRSVPTKIKGMPPIKIVAAGRNSLFIDIEDNVWVTEPNDYGILRHWDIVKKNISPEIKNIATESDHSLFIDIEGKLWNAGRDYYGQSGYINVHRKIPTMVVGIPPIKSVATESNHSLFLDTEGNVWNTGNNFEACLGLDNDVEIVRVSIQLAGMPPIQAVATGGGGHNLYLDIEGNVWGNGTNHYGQLGLNNLNDNIPSPTKIEGLPPIQAVATGENHSLFLDINGNVWATGFNQFGQLGLGDYNNRQIPTKIEGMPTIQLPVLARRKIPTKSARKIVE